MKRPRATAAHRGPRRRNWSDHEDRRFNNRQIQTADRGILRGTPASPGTYTGAARIIANERQFARIQPGDVLVCPTTRSSWSTVFATIGAVVTDAGGALSHPAIIAREQRIPAVSTGQPGP